MKKLEALKNSEKFSTESLTMLLSLGFTQWQDTHNIVELPLPNLDQMSQDTELEQGIFVNGGKLAIIPDAGIFVATKNLYLKYWLGFYVGFIEQYGGKLWCASRHVENKGLNESIKGQQLSKLYDPIIVQAAATFFQLPILSSQSVPFVDNIDPDQLYWESLGYRRTRERFETMDRIFIPG